MIKEPFGKYLEEAIGSENVPVAFSAFECPASVSVRMNPYKAVSGKVRQWEGSRPVPWCIYGQMLAERPVFTLDPAFHAGAYYVQDSSSMFVGHVLRTFLKGMPVPQGRPVRVLDLCAAPGGKTTDAAASLREAFGDRFILVANEVMKQRAGVLAGNVALWGDPNVAVTSDDPAAFSSLEGFFDIIIADVPCSGEGMFRKDEEAQMQWSADNVALCEARQRRIVGDVWPALADGGIFIYSTCTFNRYENDGNVKWIEDELGAECLLDKDVVGDRPGVLKTEKGYSLVPGFIEGEGQYCSALRKRGGFGNPVRNGAKGRKAGGAAQKGPERMPEAVSDLFVNEMMLRRKGDVLIAVPAVVASDVAFLGQELHIIAAGCAVGTYKGQTLVPDADLALCIDLKRDAYPAVDVDIDTARAFLHRDAVAFPDAPKGYLILKYEGMPIGFVKNLGNRCNSLHPQGRRIRMDIK